MHNEPLAAIVPDSKAQEARKRMWRKRLAGNRLRSDDIVQMELGTRNQETLRYNVRANVSAMRVVVVSRHAHVRLVCA
jgi:hypothetical protein